MTPEQFAKNNPNWRENVSDECAGMVLDIMRSGCFPLPWTNETIAMLEKQASELTVEVFSQYREKMGDAVFGELVLLVGEEAKRFALIARDLIARDGPEAAEGRLQ